MWTEEKQRRFDTLRRDDAAPLTPDEQQELAALFDELDREEWEQLRPALTAYEQRRQALGEELLQLEAEGSALAELERRYEDWLLRARQLVARLLHEREELRAERERVTR
jgi:Mor family transcriptional regulator